MYNIGIKENIKQGCDIIEKSKAGSKGNLTVEATLVISAMMFILAALIVFTMVMYQKIKLAQVASLAAQQGAEIWTDSRKNIEDGSWDDSKEKDPLYYRIFDDSLFGATTYKEVLHTSGKKVLHTSGKEILDTSGIREGPALNIKQMKKDDLQGRKISIIRREIYRGLSKGILKPSVTVVEIKYINTVIQREIKVTISQEIRIPFGILKSLLNGEDTLALTGSGTAAVTEPSEYIRNVDFIVEYAEKSGAEFNIEKLISGLRERVIQK